MTYKKEDLIELGEQLFGHLYNRYGEGLYSSHETLKKGNVYLLGLNPGGDGHTLLGNHIQKMLTKPDNAFIDEKWGNKHALGNAPLQKRVKSLLTGINQRVEDVCASNLIFTTSRSSSHDNYNFGFAGTFWPFHQAIIEIVQPKLILTFGNSRLHSPFGFLKSLYCEEPDKSNFEEIASGHGKWKCYGFKTNINGRETSVIGLPHLSYYSPNKEPVLKWFKEFSGI